MEKGAGKKAVVWSKAVSNEAFLAELQTLLSKASDKGSAFVTMKQVRDGEENACLVRVRYQEHKSSTLVHGKELVRFQTRLAAVTKSSWGATLPKKPSKRALRGAKALEQPSAPKRAKD